MCFVGGRAVGAATGTELGLSPHSSTALSLQWSLSLGQRRSVAKKEENDRELDRKGETCMQILMFSLSLSSHTHTHAHTYVCILLYIHIF